MRTKRGVLFVMSAPSGAGKGTLAERLMERDPNVRFGVSHTSRPPREGEQEGVHYHFVSSDEFKGMEDSREFVEWAEVHGNRYGTSRQMLESLLSEGVDVLLDIDVQGARQIRKVFPEAVFLFVMPPSMQELASRLRKRGTEDEDALKKRLHNARGELESYLEYDYVILNDSLEQAVEELVTVVRAARLTAGRMDPERVKDTFFSQEDV